MRVVTLDIGKGPVLIKGVGKVKVAPTDVEPPGNGHGRGWDGGSLKPKIIFNSKTIIRSRAFIFAISPKLRLFIRYQNALTHFYPYDL